MAAATTGGAVGLAFGVLGPLQVSRSGVPLGLGGRQQRAVLAVLLADSSAAVSVGRLADALWGDSPPPGYAATIQTYIFHLRQILEPERGRGEAGRMLVTDAAGYRLRLDGAALDADQFERLTQSGQSALARAGYPEALAELDRALGLWRGEVLADLAEYPFVAAVAGRLQELRLTALEARIEARLALGQHRAVVADLDQLIGRYPLREQLHGQRMLALYRCGRQADALTAYRELQAGLDEELGIQPSPPLQQLYESVLRQDRSLDIATPATHDAASPAAPDEDRAREPRRRLRRWASAAAAAVMLVAVAVTVHIVSDATHSSLPALPANSVGAIHSDGSLYSAVAVGQSPDGVAFGAGSLWVANTSDRTVSRIEPDSHTVVQTIPVGSQPSALTVTGQDVWVVNSGDGTVSRINTTVNQVVGQPIEVGTKPDAIAGGPSGVWVANSGDDTIQRIDPDSGTPGKPIDVGEHPDGIAVDEHTIWVGNGGDATVSQVDAATGAVSAPIHVGAGAAGIAITAGGVWVANSLELTVTRIDPATGRVVDTIPVGDGPRSIVAAGKYLWVGDQYDGTVTRIDPARAHNVHKFATGASPNGLAAAGSAVWVTSRAFSSGSHVGGTLTVASPFLPGSFTGIDPADVYAPLLNLNAQRVVYDGLVAFRLADGPAGLTVVPDLAAALPRLSDGGTTYTFTVRPEIRYSTGSFVRASDFILGMKRALTHHGGNPGFFAAVLGGQRCIDHPTVCDLSRGMTADDTAGRLVIHLAAPDPEFLYKLTYFLYPTPPNTPLTTVTTPLPGTGPYMISDYKLRLNPSTQTREKEFAALIRNPHFHQWSYAAQPAGYPDVIRWLQVANGAAGVDAVLRGLADTASDLGVGQTPGPTLQRFADSLATRYPAQLHVDVLPATEYEYLNTQVPPFKDRRVRQALNYAVDRRELVKIDGGSAFASATCQILPPNFPSYKHYCPYTAGPTDGPYNGPDLIKARALVAESGTAGAPITVYGQSDPRDHAINAYFAGVLGQLGYRVSLRELPFADATLPYLADPRHRIQITWALGWGADYPAASNFYYNLFSCASFVPANGGDNANVSEYCNKDIDRLAAHALTLEQTDPGAARREWVRVDHLMTDDAPVVATVNDAKASFASTRVGNYQDASDGPIYDQMWIK